MSYITKDVPIIITLPAITALAGLAVVGCNAPFAGSVVAISAAVNAAFTVSDIVITGRIGASNITTGAVTLATSGSAFGTTATVTPTAANTFNAGDIINCTVTGGVGTVGGAVTFILRRAA